MNLNDLDISVRRMRTKVDREIGQMRTLAQAGKDLAAEIVKLEEDIEVYDQAAMILNRIGDERQEQAQRKIEALVTRGLQTIFGEELSFHLVSTTKAKAVNVDFVVRSTLADGRQIDTPVMEARGGGLAVVVGFLLRLVVKLLRDPKGSHIMFLDESFAQLSAEYEPRLAEFMREIVDKTDVQIILITHSDAFTDQADRLHRFKLINGETHIG